MPAWQLAPGQQLDQITERWEGCPSDNAVATSINGAREGRMKRDNDL
jgi:hypothetical protein